MTVSGAERRAHERVQVRVPIEIHRGDEVLSGWSADVSEGGTRIQCEPGHELKVGDTVELAVRLPGRVKSTKLTAEVRWVDPRRNAGFQFRGGTGAKVAAFLAAFLSFSSMARADATVPEFDPNADVQLDMEAGGERPDEYNLLEAFQQQYDEFDQCVLSAKKGKDKQLPGDVDVSVLLNPRGAKPLGVNADLPDDVERDTSLRECLRSAVAAGPYPSYDGPPVVVQFSFELDPGMVDEEA